jgi:hypothetical protein
MTFPTARLACLVAAGIAVVTASAAGQARSGGAPAPRFDWTATDPSSGAVVTGAPFSADATTTVTQTLGDGTRIEQQTTAKFYRDSSGRFRREQTILGLDALNPAAQSQTIITIDTVPGDAMPWILDPGARVAARAPRPGKVAYFSGQWNAAAGLVAQRYRLQLPDQARSQAGAVIQDLARARELERAANRLSVDLSAPLPLALPPDVEPTVEALGTRDMEGIKVTGQRTTAVIPLGRIGNDQPIRITDERWESPDLRVLVYSRFSDPRTGVIEYRLANIRRAEPAADLFVVPSDYTVRESQPGLRLGGGGRGARGN